MPFSEFCSLFRENPSNGFSVDEFRFECYINGMGIERRVIMRISTKGSYALEAMLAIALHSGKGALSIREISEITEISDKYLEQIFLLLKDDRLIIGTRGIGGGYVLARSAAEITAGQILRAAENSFSPVACIDDEKLCERSGNCVTHDIWNRLNHVISDRVDHVTLEDLRSGYLRTGDRTAEQYSI